MTTKWLTGVGLLSRPTPGPELAPVSRLSTERRYGSGYNTDDFQSHLLESRLEKIRDTDLQKIKIHPQSKHKHGGRKIMFSNLPWWYEGACGIKPNDNDLASIIDGAKHRVGGKTPTINRKTLRQFAQFCKDWFRKNLNPLKWNTDVSVETWLSESPYDLKRREELLNIYKAAIEELNVSKQPDYKKLESFCKDEFYMEAKTFRTINSRVELFKCLVGPTIHAVEKEVFKLPYFIKKVPVPERPQYIYDNLFCPGNVYSGSDASNWEGSVNKDIMKACEIEFFKQMTKNLPSHHPFMVLYEHLLLTNRLCFSGFFCEILSRRMSGEMSTSIANGLTNLMLILFTAYKMGVDVRVVVEGDDALTSCKIYLPIKYFSKLGFNYVLTQFEELSEASFCGLIFSSDKHLIRDPIKTILKFGWCTQQYTNSSSKVRMQLLRAKALSLKCEMPDCPILGSLADRIISLTNGISIRKSIRQMAKSLSLWKRNEFLELISSYKPIWLNPAQVSSESRVLMEKIFKIDTLSQLQIEQDISNMHLGPWNFPVLGNFIPRDNEMFWDMYVKSSMYPMMNSVMINVRVNYYQTTLPKNSMSDYRYTVPTYAKGVGT